MTDQDIIKGLQQNDRVTTNYIYKTLGPPIYKHVLDNSGSRQDGDDLFHETYIKVWRNVQAGKYRDDNKFEAYFIQVARFTWIDHLRGNNTHWVGDDNFLLERADNSEEDALMHLVLRDRRLEALDTVWKSWDDTDCHRRLNAFHYEDKSTKEIAHTEGVEQNTLLQQLKRCRQKLFKLVSQELKGN
jgi:RNA polymerase sigma factor (sigma-70 family)